MIGLGSLVMGSDRLVYSATEAGALLGRRR